MIRWIESKGPRELIDRGFGKSGARVARIRIRVTTIVTSGKVERHRTGVVKSKTKIDVIVAEQRTITEMKHRIREMSWATTSIKK